MLYQLEFPTATLQMQTEPLALTAHSWDSFLKNCLWCFWLLQSPCLPVPVQALMAGDEPLHPGYEISSFGTHFHPQLQSNLPGRGSQEPPDPSPATGQEPWTTVTSHTEQPAGIIWGVAWGLSTREGICRVFTGIQVIKLLHQSLALHFAFMHFYPIFISQGISRHHGSMWPQVLSLLLPAFLIESYGIVLDAGHAQLQPTVLRKGDEMVLTSFSYASLLLQRPGELFSTYDQPPSSSLTAQTGMVLSTG